jgi:hypothetical protein
MNIPLSEFMLLAPELFLLSMACIILVVEAFMGQRQPQLSYVLSQLTLLVAALISWSMLDNAASVALGGTFVHDPMAALLKTSIFVITIGAFMYARSYHTSQGSLRGEYYVLGLFAVLGMLVMVSAHSLLTIYLGLELLSLSLYAMVAFDRDSSPASEAAMKYFVLGALASGMLLYGMSMLYGATGSLDIARIAAALAGPEQNSMILIFGLCFIVVGLAFKFGAVPFHMHGDASAGGIDGQPVCRLAGYADHPCRAVTGHWQCHCHCPDQHEAHAGLFNHLACGFPLAGSARRNPGGLFCRHVLCHHLCTDGDWRLWHDHPDQSCGLRGGQPG